MFERIRKFVEDPNIGWVVDTRAALRPQAPILHWLEPQFYDKFKICAKQLKIPKIQNDGSTFPVDKTTHPDRDPCPAKVHIKAGCCQQLFVLTWLPHRRAPNILQNWPKHPCHSKCRASTPKSCLGHTEKGCNAWTNTHATKFTAQRSHTWKFPQN